MKSRFRHGVTLVLSAGLAAGMVLLGGCSASNPSTASGGAPTYGGAANGAPAPEKAPGAPEAPPTTVDDGRQIARTASLALTVEDLMAATKGLHELAMSLGGVVTNESMSLPGDAGSTQGSGMVVVSVPADKLDEALSQMGDLGTITNRKIEAVDVTADVVDVDSRIATMRASIARLRALMDKTGTVTEIASLEAQLTQREADLESLLARQKSLSQRVAEAPITVSLRTTSIADQSAPNGFVSALQAGLRSLAAAGRLTLIVLGAVLPWLALAAVILVPTLMIRRRWRLNHPKPAPGRPASMPPLMVSLPQAPMPGQPMMAQPTPAQPTPKTAPPVDPRSGA
ncbi:MAG: DUF4349 domain-containing protein [Actinomycetia bacterium]|nr:DUF4349 domain-containing protein [Actinomycetes bacterium]